MAAKSKQKKEVKDAAKEVPKEAKKVLTDKQRIDAGQVLVRTVIEVLGAPKDYVEEAIQLVVDKVRNMEKAELVSEQTFEAEEKGKLFITFSELEIWFHDVDTLSGFLFDFTPSSVEILQPSVLSLKANFMNGFFNDFLLKMHDLGLKLKDTSAKVQLVQKNTDILVRNFLNAALEKPRSSEDIAKITGIPKDNVEALLANYEKAGIVTKEGAVFKLKKAK